MASTKLTAAPFDALAPHRDVVDGVMNLGTVDKNSVRPLGERGYSGQLELATLVAPEGSTAAAVNTIRKPLGAKPHHEMVGRAVAEQLGIEHLFAHTAIRDGQIYLEVRPGVTGKVSGVVDGEALLKHLEKMHTLNGAHLDGLSPARAAVRDRDLLRSYDYLTKMLDRHYRNVMVHEPTGLVSYIDQGMILPHIGDELKPYLVSTYLGGEDLGGGIMGRTKRVTVGADAMEVLHAKVSPGQLSAVLDRALSSGTGVLKSEKDVAHFGRLAADSTKAGLEARAAHLLANGSFDYKSSRAVELGMEHVGNALNNFGKLKVALHVR